VDRNCRGSCILSGGQVHAPLKIPESLHGPIFGLAEDKSGWLWIATVNHVLEVKRSSLLSDNLGDADVREYGPADGLRGTEGVKRDQSVVEDSRGRIWFSTSRGLSVVNPARATLNPVPALIHIETVLVDGKPFDLRKPLRVSGGEQNVTFRFMGLSLANSERVRYRFRLNGFDKGWSDPVAIPEARYASLEPGSYRFRATASNSDGVWNGSEASIDFRVEPTLWQTWWFRLALVLSAGLAIFVVYRLRMRQLTRLLNVRFEERLEEREAIARDLHDTLLQGLFRAAMQLDVANDRLPADSPAKPILQRVIELMNQVGEEGRATIRSLRSSFRSPHHLEKALSQVREEFPGADVDFSIVVEGEPRLLNSIVWDEVYRLGREAIINSFRHSRAKNIEVEIEYAANSLRLIVRDDGGGIDAQVLQSGREGHWGLSGMRERAEKMGAKSVVSSRVGAGTEIELTIPGSVAFDFSPHSPKWFTRLFQRKRERESFAGRR